MLPVVSDRKNMSPCAVVGVPALIVTVLRIVALAPTDNVPVTLTGRIESASAGTAASMHPTAASATCHEFVLVRLIIRCLLAGTHPASCSIALSTGRSDRGHCAP